MQGGGSGDFLVQLFPLVLIFVVFYFLLIRPQQAKVRAQREMLAGVKRGDRVVTGGGIIGLVTKVISDNEVQVELAEGVRVRIIKQTITDILTRGESVRGPKDEQRGRRQAHAAAAGPGAGAQEPAGQPVRRRQEVTSRLGEGLGRHAQSSALADHRHHAAITLLSALFALPNLLAERASLDTCPHWYATSRINLGLDLRGGAHFLLEADLRSVLTERLTNLSDSVRAELRKQQVRSRTSRSSPAAHCGSACATRPTAPRRSRRSALSIRRWRFRAAATRSG